MRIGLLTNLQGQRVWHGWLSTKLKKLGHELVIVRPPSTHRSSFPPGLKLALWLDAVLFKLKGAHAFDDLRKFEISEYSEDTVNDSGSLDVILDVSAGVESNLQSVPFLRIMFNEQSSELAAVSAVLESGPMVLQIVSGSGADVEFARPGVERHGCLTATLDNVFSALVELLIDRATIGRQVSPNPLPRTRIQMQADSSASNIRPQVNIFSGPEYIMDVVVQKIARYLNRQTRTKRRWAIATRICENGGLVAGSWPSTAEYKVVPDDGQRYFADPFLFLRNGKMHLFAEEFPYATGRGIISVAEVDGGGNVGAFRPVLERSYHLSYPFIFEHDGDVWMIPEACESGSVELYRAVKYPDEWAFEKRLIDDVPGCDATIVQCDSRYFMTLTTRYLRGSTRDNQRLFSAESPLGPWFEHAGGLVRIDCKNARPAGLSIVRDGKLLRPVQNCSDFYGGSMNLLEVQNLSGEISEVPVASITVVGPEGVVGTHTYAKCRNVEAVDIYGDLAAVQNVKLKCAESSGSRFSTGSHAHEASN